MQAVPESTPQAQPVLMPHVLALDDDPSVRQLVHDYLTENELRVTVVATGLGRPEVAHGRAPFGREVPTLSKAVPPVATPAEPAMRVVPRRPLTAADYAALDKPAVQRQRAVGDGLRVDPEHEDVLDIPAFLRRQAD